MNLRIDLYVHSDESAVEGKLDAILTLLTKQEQETTQIMADIDVANTAIARIDAASTAQGAILTQESATLKTVSDELDMLIAAGASLPPALITSLQAQADKAEAVSKSIQAQADFSTALASKGANNPVPIPVPPATPPAAPPTA